MDEKEDGDDQVHRDLLSKGKERHPKKLAKKFTKRMPRELPTSPMRASAQRSTNSFPMVRSRDFSSA